MSEDSQPKSDILARALTEGFDAVRIAAPDAIPKVGPRLTAFLDAGFHGSMDWLEARAEQRAAPKTTARSVSTSPPFPLGTP